MGISAAHKSLPFGTRVVVRNQRTGRSITVRINDRGPFVGGRIIDLSTGAKNALGMGGLAPVCLEVVSFGSGKKRGYEKPNLGERMLQTLNPFGGHDAKATVVRSARGHSSRTHTASASHHRKHYAEAGHSRKRYASARHRRGSSRRASHRRQLAANDD
jgi:rare lipoprotein A